MISSEVQRTLVKSPPELWAELSDPDALARHLGELGEIRITRAEPEKLVEWEAQDATGTIAIKPSGWGTRVTLTVSRELPSTVSPDAPETPLAETPEAVEPTHSPAPATLEAPDSPRLDTSEAIPTDEPAPTGTPEAAAMAEAAPMVEAPEMMETTETAPHGEVDPAPEWAPAEAIEEPASTTLAEPEAADALQAWAEQESGLPVPPAEVAPEPLQEEEPLRPFHPEPLRPLEPRRGLFSRLFGRGRREPRPPMGSLFGQSELTAAREVARRRIEATLAAAPVEALIDDPVAEVQIEPLGEPSAQPDLGPEPLAPEQAEPIPVEPEPFPTQPEPFAVDPQPFAVEPEPHRHDSTVAEKDLASELLAAEETAAEEVRAVLTAVLDRLGAAHHRPFSRG